MAERQRRPQDGRTGRRDGQAENEPEGQGESNPEFGRYVALLANSMYKGIAERAAPYDLSPLDVYLLMVCMDKGECTATQLAQLLPVDASRVSRLVTGLADRRLLRRRRLRNDRRVVMLRLSPEGNEVTAEITRNMQEYYAMLTRGLSDRDMRSFSNIALRILANYEAIVGSE